MAANNATPPEPAIEDPHFPDPNLTFAPEHILEGLQNKWFEEEPPGEFVPRGEFAHLRDAVIPIEEAGLTDKQLQAVSLVFYGRVSKKRAARVMKISSQAVTDHLTAALKKLQAVVG